MHKQKNRLKKTKKRKQWRNKRMNKIDMIKWRKIKDKPKIRKKNKKWIYKNNKQNYKKILHNKPNFKEK